MIDSSLISSLLSLQSQYSSSGSSSSISQLELTEAELTISAAENPNTAIATQDYSEINSLNAGEQQLKALEQMDSLLGGSASSSSSYGNYNSLLSMLGSTSDDDDDDDDASNESGLFGSSSSSTNANSVDNQIAIEIKDAMLLSMLSQDSKASASQTT